MMGMIGLMGFLFFMLVLPNMICFCYHHLAQTCRGVWKRKHFPLKH